VHNLNDVYRDQPKVKLVVVLGEWEDMVQLWVLPRRELRDLLADGVLDGARNLVGLQRVLEG
jgi:hypothetical protein